MASNAFPAFSVLVNTGEPLDFQYFITYLGIGAYGAEGSFPKCLKIQASKQKFRLSESELIGVVNLKIFRQNGAAPPTSFVQQIAM